MVFFYPFPAWDGVTYLLNARHYLGNSTYFEEFRPPFLSWIISGFYLLFGMNDYLVAFIPVLFSAFSLLIIYKVGEEFFSKEVGLLAFVLAIFNPYHLKWSAHIYTDIMSSAIALTSLFFFHRGLKGKGYNSILAFFFAGLAGLSRYVYIAMIPLILVLHILLKHDKKNFFNILKDKQLILGLAIVAGLFAPWLLFNYINYGSPLHSFTRANEIISGNTYSTEWDFYLKRGIEIFSLSYLIFPLAVLFSVVVFIGALLFTIKRKGIFRHFKSYVKSLKPLFIILGYFFGFAFYLQFVLAHREVRYLWPLFAPIIILSSFFIFEFAKKWGAMFRESLIVFILINSLILFSSLPLIFADKEMCGMQPIADASRFVAGKGTVLSPFWPYPAYYGGVVSFWMPRESEFESFIAEKNASIVMGISSISEPLYSTNRSFFDSKQYLNFVKEFEDSCTKVWIYEVVNFTVQ